MLLYITNYFRFVHNKHKERRDADDFFLKISAHKFFEKMFVPVDSATAKDAGTFT